MITLAGIDPLLARYAAFLIDQFGTLHDGSRAYPGAAAALARMRAAGKRVVLLSNSGRPAAANARRLARLGIGPDAYDLLLTSGEAGARLLAEGRIPELRGMRHCLLLEREGEGSVRDDLDLVPVDAVEAEFVLIAGSEGETRPLGWYEALLAPLARRGVPALCLNPDRIMLTPAGLAFGSGQIAELYQRLGGAVTWIGKPYPAIYDMALAALAGVAPAAVAGIGDSVEHDIAGARRAGCGAWLTRTGIIAGWDDAAIAAECARWGVAPDGVVERFA